MTATKGKRRRKGKRPQGSWIYDPWPRLLHEAGVSGNEWAVFVALAEHPQRNGYLSRPVRDYNENMTGLSSATGLATKQVDKALSALQRKTFVHPETGEPTPILTSIVKAKPGTCAVYRCNMPKEFFLDGTDATQKGDTDNTDATQP